LGPSRKVPYTKGMSTGLAARVAAVCVALVASADAQPGDRRKVAVVDLSQSEAGAKLRDAFNEELQVHWALRSLGAFDVVLQRELLDEDREHRAIAQKDLADADDALTRFDYDTAIKDAKGGEGELWWATPTEGIALYADLLLVEGQAYLGQNKLNEATEAFALVHQLQPLRQLDPGRYLPEVVEFFVKARPNPQTAKLQVIGKGRLWIDGIDRGSAPGTFEVTEGEHVVQLTGKTRITRGDRVFVPKSASLEIPDQPASTELEVQRARLALAKAPDSAARAGAMQELAKLLDVHDAVLIDTRNGGLAVQTWRDRAPGFSEFVAYKDQKPIDLLLPLAPANPPDEPRVAIPFTPPVHVDETPWWDHEWVQGSAALGATIVVVGIVLYATRDQYVSGWDTNIQSAGPVSR
jgi:hypothetical protein